MMKIKYKVGSVTEPTEDAPLIIVHCVNDCAGGVMGSGVASALAKKWPQIKQCYHNWANDKGCMGWTSGLFRLGEIQLVHIKSEPDWRVCNLVGQRDIVDFHGIPPVRYESVREGLWNLRDWAENNKIKTIISPLMCSLRAGGEWSKIESLIYEVFAKSNFEWTVYCLTENDIPIFRFS
jgi:O-acetyl-ADP-ribose deacetylase (regulator of RNase III)